MPLATPSVGDHLTVTTGFMSNSKEKVFLRAGLQGTVVEVDEDGDACIRSDELRIAQWVYQRNFGHLSFRLRGIVAKWFEERGFGFINPVLGGEHVFCHSSALNGGSLRVQAQVEYDVAVNDRNGKPMAVNVTGPAVVARAAEDEGSQESQGTTHRDLLRMIHSHPQETIHKDPQETTARWWVGCRVSLPSNQPQCHGHQIACDCTGTGTVVDINTDEYIILLDGRNRLVSVGHEDNKVWSFQGLAVGDAVATINHCRGEDCVGDGAARWEPVIIPNGERGVVSEIDEGGDIRVSFNAGVAKFFACQGFRNLRQLPRGGNEVDAGDGGGGGKEHAPRMAELEVAVAVAESSCDEALRHAASLEQTLGELRRRALPVAVEAMEAGDISDGEAWARALLERLAERRRELRLCKVCLDAAAAVLFLPCKHRALCEGCAARVTDCPICRQPIEHRIDVIDS